MSGENAVGRKATRGPERAMAAMAVASLAMAQPATEPLRPFVLNEGIPALVETNVHGLGAEATRVEAWIKEATESACQLKGERLVGPPRPPLILSPEMARSLRRLDQWSSLEAPESHPITHEQLRAGALSETAIDGVRRIFERAIARGVRVGGSWLTPETGGEAVLDGSLLLAEAADSRFEIARELVRRAGEPSEVKTFYASRTAAIDAMDSQGLLRNALGRWAMGSPGSAAEVRRAVETIAENAAPTYVHEPEDQIRLILSRDWKGRYVGRWHTHGPHERRGAWVEADPPSFEDMTNALHEGQYLTLAFHPEGFDLYDAAALSDAGRVDLKLLRTIRHRSPQWREHFRRLLPKDAR